MSEALRRQLEDRICGELPHLAQAEVNALARIEEELVLAREVYEAVVSRLPPEASSGFTDLQAG